MMCINVLNIMMKTEVLNPVFTIIDKKVTFQSEREKVKSSIVEILNAPKNLVSIDINDARDLFQKGGEIHTCDASVGASMKKRMELLMDLIIENTKKYEPFSHALMFFFFPKDHPLLMSELQPFSDWIKSVPGDFLIKWGMATHSTHELRAIVLLQ